MILKPNCTNTFTSMKFTRQLLLLTIATALLSTPALRAQCDVKATMKADFAYKSNAFLLAADLYKKAKGKAKKDKAAKICIQYHIAKCYSKMGEFKKAETQFKSLTSKEGADAYIYLDYANVVKVQGRYEEAKVLFEKYKELNPSDPRGEIGAQSCDLAIKWKDNPTCYQVENMKEWNTKQMDFAAAYASKKMNHVIFTSNRPKSYGGENLISGELWEDMYESKKDKQNKWSVPTALSDEINTKNTDGVGVMDGKFRTLYFTRCFSSKKDGSYCQIYKSTRQGQTWTAAEKLGLSTDSFVTGHPTITADAKFMIFASNMKGGFGGMDLWYATYDKKQKDFVNPVNLGPEINSADNEMYPFLKSDGTLYFSSNRPEGMGGLDIFKAVSTGENTWGNPENMKSPINSESDDFGIFFETGKETGFLSSNRAKGVGSDDIYRFYVPEATITLSGTVRDKDTREVIEGATVEMKDKEGNVITATSDKTGFYKLEIPFGVEYDMQATKKDYYNDVNRASTAGLDPMINCKDTNIVADFNLKTTKVVLEFEIQFIFNQAEPLKEYVDSVNNLLLIIQDNPQVVVEIGAHTDSRGSTESNQKLSERRANWIVAYLIEKGIPADRLVAKGYGEEQPRELTKNMTGLTSGRVFEKGTVLTEEYINGLKTSEGDKQFEDAHTLNRRVSFKILSEDYKGTAPKEDDDAE